MPTLDIISVNIWQILISLINLFIIFLILKKFLYKPVKKVLDERKKTLDDSYSSAAEAERQAQENKEAWEKKMETASEEAEDILQSATANANRRSERIIAEARERADGIIRQAETDADLERKKAEDDIKQEIVTVSTALTERILGREITTEDHQALIDAFIDDIDEDGNK